MPIQVICSTCGKSILKRPCDIKRANRYYCSQECHLKQLRNSIKSICVQCGIETTVPFSKKGKKFCSRECKNAWQKINLKGANNPCYRGGAITYQCEYCGDEFKRRRGYGGNGRFCSNECKAKWQSENVFGEYHPNWQGGKTIRECLTCKNKFEVTPARIQYGQGNFCSRSCFAKSRIGNKNPNYKNPIEKTELVSYYKNHTIEETAIFFGVSDPLITQWLKEYNIPVRTPLINPQIIECNDGHKVRSSFERIIDDWLFLHKIPHKYNPETNTQYHADFKVGDYFIEVWGLDSIEEYCENKELKKAAYSENGIKLIEIEVTDIKNNLLNEKLGFLIPLYGGNTKTLTDYA